MPGRTKTTGRFSPPRLAGAVTTPTSSAGIGLKPPSWSSGAQQPLDHPLRGLGVAEIGEMADLGPLGEEGARRRVAGHAAVHGAGVDDEVVVLAEEQVGRQDLEPAQDAGPLDVALEHGQIGGGGDARPVQQPDQRRPRDHRLEAGDGARVRPLLDHGQEEGGDQVVHLARERARHRADPEADSVQDEVQPAVQPVGGERGAPRRAGDPDVALDARAQRDQGCAEPFQSRALLDPIGAGRTVPAPSRRTAGRGPPAARGTAARRSARRGCSRPGAARPRRAAAPATSSAFSIGLRVSVWWSSARMRSR